MKKRSSPVGETRRMARPRRINLSELAYAQLEELIVRCELRPGSLLSIQDLQDRTGFGRTPMHQAVSLLAQETLIRIRPRHGLQIAPVNLMRERTLLELRREMERFVIRLATLRGGAAHRAEAEEIAGELRGLAGVAGAEGCDLDRFNRLDRRIDHLLLAAAGEPFLESTLRPLHTIFRRTGWIYHRLIRPEEGLQRTLACHLAILEAMLAGRVPQALAACDQTIDFVETMFDVLGPGIDPALFDAKRPIPVEA